MIEQCSKNSRAIVTAICVDGSATRRPSCTRSAARSLLAKGSRLNWFHLERERTRERETKATMTTTEKVEEALPHWDLSNVYPGLESDHFQRDVDELNRQLDELDVFL